MKAGGKMAPASRSTQCKFAELYDADGWNGYFSKTSADTKTRLGTVKIMHVSQSLNAVARADWSAASAIALAA